MFQKKEFIKDEYVLNYAVDYPKNFDVNKSYPVVFYFHGMGMVQKGIDFVIQECPVRRERIPEDLDFIIVAPSCDDHMWFENFKNLVHFIEYVENKPYVDETRCSITGSSMGGYTCWLLAVLHSELFSGGVICCGGGLYWAGEDIKMPIIAVHGDADDTVLFRESELMVKKVNEHGGNAKLVTKKGFGHGIWTETYSDPEMYKWLFINRRVKG